MSKASPIITSCNSGEFSPLLAGRTDIKYWGNACRRLRNFIPMPQGPGRRRPGTRFVAEVKNSAHRTWLASFEFSADQAYVLEIGDRYIRFYASHGVVQTSPGSGIPFEVSTPWLIDDLTGVDGTLQLRVVQSGDVMYLVHNDVQPQKLERLAAALFTLTPLDLEGGPFKDVDLTQTITVWASAATGNITLNASSSIFNDARMVGMLFLLEQRAADAVLAWEAGKAVTVNDIRQSDGKNYKALQTGTTGTIKPTHTSGAKFDGAAVQWEFQDPGYGWCKITDITGLTATATVLSRFPAQAVGAPQASTRWAFGAFSNVVVPIVGLSEENGPGLGWPDSVTFFRERLVLAKDRSIYTSKSGDFENFNRKDDGGQIVADGAIIVDTTSDRADRIEWISPTDKGLLVGTAGDEQVLTEITTSEPFGPKNAFLRKQTGHGSRHVQPVRVGDGVIFVQKAGRKIRDIRFQFERDAQSTTDLTVLAEHVPKGGVIDMIYQQEPDSVVWMARKDGALLGFTLNREQDVRGWHPHRIGGFADVAKKQFAKVEAITVVPSPDGERDDLWMIVQRTVNGVTRRYVEFMEKYHEEGDDQQDAFYVDSGLTLDNLQTMTLQPGTGANVEDAVNVVFIAGASVFAGGDVGKFIHFRHTTISITGKITYKLAVAEITAFDSVVQVKCTINEPFPNLDLILSSGWRMTVTVISGLGHLAGETVAIWADGAVQPSKVVSGGGTITFSTPASKAQVGLGGSAVMQPMPIDAGAEDGGTAQGKTMRAHKVTIRFNETIGVKFGTDEDKKLDEITYRKPTDLMDIAVPLFTGDKLVSWPEGYEGQLLITIVQDQPAPCTVVAIMPHMVTYGAR